MKWIKTYENFNEYDANDIQDIFIDFLDQTGYELEIVGNIQYKRQSRFFSAMNLPAFDGLTPITFDAFSLKFKNNGSVIKEESLEELKIAIERFSKLYKLNLKTIQIGTSYWLSTISWGMKLELSDFFKKIINLKPLYPGQDPKDPKNFEYIFSKKDFYLVFEKS